MLRKKSVSCKDYNGKRFTIAMILSKVPAVTSYAGDYEIVRVPVCVCMESNTVIVADGK